MEDSNFFSAFSEGISGKKIPIEFIDIKSKNATAYKVYSGTPYLFSGKKTLQFPFKGNWFIEKIEVHFKGSAVKGELSIGETKFSGSVHKANISILVFEVGIFTNCCTIELIPPNSDEVGISEINAFGLSHKEVEKLQGVLKEGLALREELLLERSDLEEEWRSFNAHRDELQENIEESEALLAAKQSEIAKLDAAMKTKRAEQKEIESQITNRNNSITTLQGNIEQLETKRGQLSEDISKKESELKGLNDEIALFPEEITEFYKQTSKDITTNFRLAFLPLLSIVILIGFLIIKAAGIAKLAINDSISYMDLIVSRLPFMAVTITVFTILYQLAKKFINSVHEIQQQRRDVIAISIIARESTNEAASKLPDYEEEGYWREDDRKARLEYKLELLKPYIKNLFKSHSDESPDALDDHKMAKLTESLKPLSKFIEFISKEK